MGTEENLTSVGEDWRTHLITDHAGVQRVLKAMRRVAVIGIKPETVGGAAYYVPRAMQGAGMDVVPVPVYYPDVTAILGAPVHRQLAELDPPADSVVLFRRPADVAKHVDEILAAKPARVWMQLGIQNDSAAEQFARAGIDVVQDRCVLIELG